MDDGLAIGRAESHQHRKRRLAARAILRIAALLLMRANTRETTIRCENCGRAGAHIRRLTRSYGKGPGLLVVENVPVVSCLHCGATYLTAETLHEVERIKAHRRSVAKRRNVAVAEFVWQRGAGSAMLANDGIQPARQKPARVMPRMAKSSPTQAR